MNPEQKKITILCNNHHLPFKSEVDNHIQNFLDKENLVFVGNDYKTYWENWPNEIRFHVVFQTRKKTPDELFREQLEYFISNL